MRRRTPLGPHSTTASQAPCQHCRRPLWYAWDEGLRVRADTPALDPPVAAALRALGRRVYVLTRAGHLIYESAERAGSLRLVQSRHAEHVCRSEPAARGGGVTVQPGLFDLDGVRPAAGGGGMR